MFFSHPIFWLAVALFFLFRMQRRQMRRRWAMGGPFDYGPPFGWGPWGRVAHNAQYAQQWAQQQQPPQAPAAPQTLAQPDRTLVESLESRIAELETRLEFAERLMATKKE
jgi:hypothetical protein